jgi:hypothetical protein
LNTRFGQCCRETRENAITVITPCQASRAWGGSLTPSVKTERIAELTAKLHRHSNVDAAGS